MSENTSNDITVGDAFLTGVRTVVCIIFLIASRNYYKPFLHQNIFEGATLPQLFFVIIPIFLFWVEIAFRTLLNIYKVAKHYIGLEIETRDE